MDAEASVGRLRTRMKHLAIRTIWAGALIAGSLLFPTPARAHCDTMDGPVVQAAKLALETKDITPVLKWVQKSDEAEVKAAFARTLAVRSQGAAARDLADQFFFETLVRVHRAGEGAPFTGLKPAGTDLAPAVRVADQALETGAVETLVKYVDESVTEGIRRRFAEVLKRKRHAHESVEAGRAFVAAYVEYVHYVEALDKAAGGAGEHLAPGQLHKPKSVAGLPAEAEHHH